MDKAADQAAGGTGERSASDALRWLEFHWGEGYRIGRDDEHGWYASRRDQVGELLSAEDAESLSKLITEDYEMRPLPSRPDRW